MDHPSTMMILVVVGVVMTFTQHRASIPGILYGGGDLDDSKLSSYSTSPLPWLSRHNERNDNNDYDNDNSIGTIIDPNILSTYRYIYHEKYTSQFSKVMIDVSRLNTTTSILEWSKNHAKSIHNPSTVCGYNGKWDSGADYYSSIFRLNHYIGSKESFLERQGDFRSRTIELYNKKFQKINTTKNPLFYDHDILPWIDLFINKLGNNITKVKQLLFQPLESYVHYNGTGTE
jgi:hypothetical protein